MNYEQPRFPHPRPQPPAQPPQRADAGADPAAAIAARTAAVARNRQKSERAALIHDMLRIVCVAVLIGGVCLYAYLKHRQNMAEERQRAEQAREERVAREKAREADAARRKQEQDALKAAAAEERARKDKLREEAARKAEAARAKNANVDRCRAARERFRGTALDLISAAPESDIPAKVATETWFSCIVPGSQRNLTLYEIQALPGREIHVTLLGADGQVEEIPLDEFNRRVSKSPYLLAKGARCYYRSAVKGVWKLDVPVPDEGERIDPSLEDFRDLYAFVRQQCSKTASVSYEVFFRDVGGAETRVRVVPFGEVVRRKDVVEGLKAAGGAHASRLSTAAALKARLNEGRLVIRRKGGAR